MTQRSANHRNNRARLENYKNNVLLYFSRKLLGWFDVKWMSVFSHNENTMSSRSRTNFLRYLSFLTISIIFCFMSREIWIVIIFTEPKMHYISSRYEPMSLERQSFFLVNLKWNLANSAYLYSPNRHLYPSQPFLYGDSFGFRYNKRYLKYVFYVPMIFRFEF